MKFLIVQQKAQRCCCFNWFFVRSFLLLLLLLGAAAAAAVCVVLPFENVHPSLPSSSSSAAAVGSSRSVSHRKSKIVHLATSPRSDVGNSHTPFLTTLWFIWVCSQCHTSLSFPDKKNRKSSLFDLLHQSSYNRNVYNLFLNKNRKTLKKNEKNTTIKWTLLLNQDEEFISAKQIWIAFGGSFNFITFFLVLSHTTDRLKLHLNRTRVRVFVFLRLQD